MKNLLKVLAFSMLGGMISLGSYKLFFEEESSHTYIETQRPLVQPVNYAPVESTNFTLAAESTVHAVVHVKTAVKTNGYRNANPWDFFFGIPPQNSNGNIQLGSGSGVIISEDGYIVTNNHVIDRADETLVKLNNGEEYKATLVGADPTTDIALLKIEPTAPLEYIHFSNSDKVKLGEWVLAVGNPFNLTSTVTAGIVSAKGRNIGIIDEQFAIESFIQTDAAVNPGNSGGALVNVNGDLIGINSAISSNSSGTFMGYSFAVPSNIVKKVVEDLKNHGTVQRAFIGVNITDVNPEIVDRYDLSRNTGVFVSGLSENGAAREAGIETEDIIIAIDDEQVNKGSELQEQIGRKRPGDEVKVSVLREDEIKDFYVTLRNSEGTTDVVKMEDLLFVNKLGGSFRPLKDNEKRRIGIDYGILVEEVSKGILAKQNIPEGFIITRVNNRRVKQVDEINKAVENLDSGEAVVIQGIMPNGGVKYFAFAK